MDKFVVTAPYVTLKVNDPHTGLAVREFYRDAVLPDGAVAADVERLLGKGMLGKVQAPDPEPPAPEQTPSQHGAAGGAEAARPAGNASRDDWAAYAAGKGAPAEETRPVEEGGLPRDELRAKYSG